MWRRATPLFESESFRTFSVHRDEIVPIPLRPPLSPSHMLCGSIGPCSTAGKDATQVFYGIHDIKAFEMLPKFFVADVQNEVSPATLCPRARTIHSDIQPNFSRTLVNLYVSMPCKRAHVRRKDTSTHASFHELCVHADACHGFEQDGSTKHSRNVSRWKVQLNMTHTRKSQVHAHGI